MKQKPRCHSQTELFHEMLTYIDSLASTALLNSSMLGEMFGVYLGVCC